MTSHVDEQVQARIAAARQKTQQQREDREAFAEQRAAGLVARKRTKLARRCAVCDRPLTGGKGRACVRGCGVYLCRAVRRPPCSDVHGGMCAEAPANRGDIPTVGEAS